MWSSCAIWYGNILCSISTLRRGIWRLAIQFLFHSFYLLRAWISSLFLCFISTISCCKEIVESWVVASHRETFLSLVLWFVSGSYHWGFHNFLLGPRCTLIVLVRPRRLSQFLLDAGSYNFFFSGSRSSIFDLLQDTCKRHSNTKVRSQILRIEE